MKILHITQNYYPSVGGTQHTIKKVSEYFTEIMHDEVTVFTSNSLYGPNRPAFKLVTPAEEVINGVKIKRFPFQRFHLPVLKFISRLLAVAGKSLPARWAACRMGPVSGAMEKAIDMHDADVIGASSIDYLFADYPLKRDRRKNAKPFVIYGGLHLHNTAISPTIKKRIQAADYYIANTEYEKAMLVAAGFNQANIQVTGAGSDIYSKADFAVTQEELLKKYAIEKDTIVITYIGRQEAQKGLPLLLAAFNTLAQKHTIFLFVCGAKGGYTVELEKAVETNSRIKLFTNITDLQKTEILRVTDILVLPSKEESFGVVFLEAWCFSKPVIGANIGAVASLISNGVDGLLFNPGDADDLSKKIEMLILDNNMRMNFGLNGNKKFRENYTWDIVAEKFRQVYQLAITKFNNKQAV